MKIKELKNQWMVTIKDSEIQRAKIWPENFKTQLIESIFHNQPIGVITLFQQDGNDYFEVSDGKQRLYALESFWRGELNYDGRYFTNQTFTPAEIETFWNYDIQIQSAKGSFDDKVTLFNKINTIVVPLKPFELLRAKYYGRFINGLQDYVNNDKNIKQVLKENNRGENELLVLDIIKGNTKTDDFLKEHYQDDFTKFIKEPRNIFLFIVDLFKSFKDLKVLITLAKDYQKHKSDLFNQRDAINDDIKHLLKANHVEGWNKLSAYERILDRYLVNKDPHRLFSRDIKETLWNEALKPVICQLCLQSIDSIEKAEVDHKKAWSLGGQTTIANAQLTHRYCNQRKSNH